MLYNKSNSDSNNESNNEKEDNDRTLMKHREMISGFLFRRNSIFLDSNEKDNDQMPKKPMETIHGFLSSRLKGIITYNNEIDNAKEDDDNPINSYINPTN